METVKQTVPMGNMVPDREAAQGSTEEEEETVFPAHSLPQRETESESKTARPNVWTQSRLPEGDHSAPSITEQEVYFHS